MIKVGVVGGTGYTGIELLRLLLQHAQVELIQVCSRSEDGQALSTIYPSLRGATDLKFSQPDVESLKACDLVFFATPNGIAMKSTQALVDAGVKVIDLAADFRFSQLDVWQQWYGMEHACPDLMQEAVYGLPELNREEIKNARIVGSAGCYTTATQLAIKPLLEKGLIDAKIIVDAKSGVSGAGKSLNVGSLFSEASESFSAYAVSGHRHQPEIVESLNRSCDADISLTFVPHLVPMVRGILCTTYMSLKGATTLEEVQAIYEKAYQNEPFVDVMPAQSHPKTKDVRSSNLCQISVHMPSEGQLVVLSVIDNLVKGAAGQAIQNMNLMYGFAEKDGLEGLPLAP